jgi:hypothetical protein
MAYILMVSCPSCDQGIWHIFTNNSTFVDRHHQFGHIKASKGSITCLGRREIYAVFIKGYATSKSASIRPNGKPTP